MRVSCRNERKSHALLMCSQVGRKRGKSVTRESDVSFGERMVYAHLAFFDQNRLELWNTPILSHFQRVGRAALSAVEMFENLSAAPRC